MVERIELDPNAGDGEIAASLVAAAADLAADYAALHVELTDRIATFRSARP